MSKSKARRLLTSKQWGGQKPFTRSEARFAPLCTKWSTTKHVFSTSLIIFTDTARGPGRS